VALASGEQEERRLPSLAVDAEDRAPLAVGLRDVVLHAASEPRAVASFSVTGAQGVYGYTTLPQLLDSRFDGRPCSVGRVRQVLGEGLLVYPQRKAGAARRRVD